MKLSCDVINDLLPLYHDEVCSEDTRKLVEEHLNECEVCRDIANKIGIEFHIPRKELDEITFFKSIQQKLRNRDIRLAVIGVILLCIVAFGSYFAETYQFIPVGASSFEVSKIAQLSDGAIGFQLSILDGKDVCSIITNSADKNGVVYIYGRRSLSENWRKTSEPTGFHNDYYYYNAEHYNQWLSALDQTANGDLPYVTEVRFGTEDDYVLIWKEGIALPEASPGMENDYNPDVDW